MEGVSESRKENQTKGDKKDSIKMSIEIICASNKKFFGNGLKDKNNTKNNVGEESIVWK